MRIKKEKPTKSSFFPPPNPDQENETGWQVSYLDIITLLLASFIIILSVSQTEVSSPISDYFQSTGETQFIQTPIEEIKNDLEKQLQPEIDQGKISIVRELNDLSITFNSRRLYQPGEAILIEEARPLLDKVLNALQATYQYNFNIDVEGHTDNTPIIESSYPSNWELSTARAANVVKYLSDLNVDESRLKASGYAYSQPLVPNEDADGNSLPENKEQNRRIVLRIYQDEDQIKQPQKAPENVSDFSLNSWENSNCSYSIQTGGYQTFSNAIQAANKATSVTDLDFQLIFNNSIFSVRSTNDLSLQEAIQLQPQISRLLSNNNIHVIHQCDQAQPWLQYQIQLGSFRQQENADRFLLSLTTDYNIEAISDQTSSGIKVLTPPLNDLRTAGSLLNKIKNIDSLSDSFLLYNPKTSGIYEREYRLQLASFPSERNAIRFLNSLPNQLNLKPELQNIGSLILVIDKSIQDWNQLLEIKREMSNDFNTTPIIHLIESPESPNALSL